MANGEPGDPMRGLSVEFLRGPFLELMGVSEQNSLTVADAEPRIRELSASIRCPRDGRYGSAYVDAASDSNAGRAKHMLSYTWAYALIDIAEVLTRYCTARSLPLSGVRVWMCCVCINQHRVKEAVDKGETVPFADFKNAFSERVRNVQHILAMMSPWEGPASLTRVWCIFEFFIALEEKKELTILMPEAQQAAFRNALLAGQQNRVFNAMSHVCVQEAKASVEADRLNILKYIDEGAVDYNISPKIAALNEGVRTKIQSWFVNAGAGHLEEQLEEGRPGSIQVHTSIASLLIDSFLDFSRARWILRAGLAVGPVESADGAEAMMWLAKVELMERNHLRAEALLERARQILFDLGQEESSTFAAVLVQQYNVCFYKDDAKGQHESLTMAKMIYDGNHAKPDINYARVLKYLGNYHESIGEATDALHFYKHAQEIYIQLDSASCSGYAGLLLGIAHTCQGQDKLNTLEQSLCTYTNIGMLTGHPVARVLKEMAKEHRNQQNLQQALHFFKRALEALPHDDRNSALLKAVIHHQLGYIHGQLNDLEAQRRAYQQALLIYDVQEELDAPAQKEHAQLLEDIERLRATESRCELDLRELTGGGVPNEVKSSKIYDSSYEALATHATGEWKSLFKVMDKEQSGRIPRSMAQSLLREVIPPDVLSDDALNELLNLAPTYDKHGALEYEPFLDWVKEDAA